MMRLSPTSTTNRPAIGNIFGKRKIQIAATAPMVAACPDGNEKLEPSGIAPCQFGRARMKINFTRLAAAPLAAIEIQRNTAHVAMSLRLPKIQQNRRRQTNPWQRVAQKTKRAQEHPLLQLLLAELVGELLVEKKPNHGHQRNHAYKNSRDERPAPWHCK